MTTQTPTTEERLSRLEGAYEQVNERLGDLRSEMNERLTKLERGQESLRSDINNLRNTIILAFAGAWVTTVGGLIALFTRL